MRYLTKTKTVGIEFPKTEEDEKLTGYSDADYANEIPRRKSTSGYVVFYCGGLVSWSSKKQSTIATATSEAELYAAFECTKDLLYLKNLILEITGNDLKADLFVDNTTTIKQIKDGVMKRSKHVEIKYYFVHEKVEEGQISVHYCPTDEQIGDILTKPLGNTKFEYFKAKLVSSLMSKIY